MHKAVADQDEIHRMAHSEDLEERRKALYQLSNNFSIFYDKALARKDLLALIKDEDWEVRWGAAEALSLAINHVTDKVQATEDILSLTNDENWEVRWGAAEALGSAFTYVTDKNESTKCLLALTGDEAWTVRLSAVLSLDSAFFYVTDKDQAAKDMLALLNDDYSEVRKGAAHALTSFFAYIKDKAQATKDMLALIKDENSDVRKIAAEAVASAFHHLTDKEQATKDLLELTKDEDIDVRAYANHSLGRVYIFKATEAENDEKFKKEFERALEFFEISSREGFSSNPASFCLPFYKSFYTIIFEKEDPEYKVQEYLDEAKYAVEESESKEKLLEAIENLSNALKEAQKVWYFNEMKSDLNAYRRYLDRACELLETTDEKAPGASRLIRRGLPIIDERIKEIIAEIQEKAKALCKQVRDTEYKEIGQQVNNVGQELSKVIDPIRLEKEVSHMLIPLSAMCKKMPEEDRGEACEIFNQINDEQNVEDKLQLISMFLSKISTQMNKERISANIHIENSEGAQVIVGTGNKQVHESNFSLK